MTTRSAFDPFAPLRRKSRRSVADALTFYGRHDDHIVVEFKRMAKAPNNVFVTGFARLIDVAGALDNPFAASDGTPSDLDRRAIAYDWWQVGEDLNDAIITTRDSVSK